MIFAPYDSHGLQLLIKDLYETAPFNDTLLAAQRIARGFHKAKKQYAILREIQIDIYNKEQALILSVITRWGTQYHLCQSIHKNKDALQRWAIRKDTEIGKKNNLVKESILDDLF